MSFVPPKGYTEQQVLDIIERVVAMLAPSFVHGYHDIDDLRQQGRQFCIEALDRYDPSLPLANFLYINGKNRYLNFLRRTRRADAPCKPCHAGHPCTNGQFCKKYQSWTNRNKARANVMRPLDISNIADEKERNTRVPSESENKAELKEILDLIDEKLPVELRGTYLAMRAGVSVSKGKREEVETVVKEIIGMEIHGE